MNKANLQNKLTKHNIKTFQDLDNYIKNQGVQTDKFGNKHYMSRFNALAELSDKETAHIILHNLSINQL